MSENDPFTANSEDGAETRIITHTNGDRTIVPADLSDEHDAELSALSGPELAARVEAVRAEQEAEADRKARAEATAQVLDDPGPVTVVSTSAAGMAGPDPVTQGGAASDGEGGAGRTYPVTLPAPGAGDAETVKVAEAARPDGGVTPGDDQGDRTVDDGQQLDQAHADADGTRQQGPNY